MRVTVYRERYGSAFPDIGEAMIKAMLPLASDLGRWHLGLTSEPPPRRIHPSESRWLEGLSKGKLESVLNQMSKTQRFGALPDELESLFVKRVKNLLNSQLYLIVSMEYKLSGYELALLFSVLVFHKLRLIN